MGGLGRDKREVAESCMIEERILWDERVVMREIFDPDDFSFS